MHITAPDCNREIIKEKCEFSTLIVLLVTMKGRKFL